jgi:hypothetical protein
MRGRRHSAAIHDDALNSIRAWLNRIRDPNLTALLKVQAKTAKAISGTIITSKWLG